MWKLGGLSYTTFSTRYPVRAKLPIGRALSGVNRFIVALQMVEHPELAGEQVAVIVGEQFLGGGQSIKPRFGTGITRQCLIVAAGGEFAFQIREQRGITRRIVGADVVRLVDDAATEEPRPDTIYHAPCKPRIVWRNQPIGEDLARITIGG